MLQELPDSFQLDKLPSVDFLQKELLPETAGIYFATSEDREVVWYIGQTQNIRTRWINHHRYDQLNRLNKKSPIKFLWYVCNGNKKNLIELENHFIEIYHPILNRTDVEAKKINPVEIELRNTLAKIAKYVIVYGYETNSKVFGLPTVYLMYDWVYKNPARILRSIFDAVNKRGGLRWSYHRRVKQTPIWKTKCNGICVVVGAETNINDVVQRAEECTLAGGVLLNISVTDFHEQAIKNNWHKNSYHTELERYSKDPIPLLWSKDVEISQGNANTLKKLHQQRTEKKASNYRYRPRGRKVRVACTSIGWGIDFVTEAYKEAIEWFGGYEVLGLRETYSQPSLPRFARGWKPHKVTVRLPEVENGTTKYRSLSAPISASTREELLQRLENIKRLSPLHQRVKLEI